MDRDDMRDNIERATAQDAVDDQPVCAGCLEFGTICRPCRRERYEAALAARQLAERRRVRVALAGGTIVLLVLVVVQALLDRSCGVGRSWNSDMLACEVRR